MKAILYNFDTQQYKVVDYIPERADPFDIHYEAQQVFAKHNMGIGLSQCAFEGSEAYQELEALIKGL